MKLEGYIPSETCEHGYEGCNIYEWLCPEHEQEAIDRAYDLAEDRGVEEARGII